MAFITRNQCLAVGQQRCEPCSGAKDACRILQDRGFISGQPKNGGRFDPVTQTTFAVALWACVDAGLPIGGPKRRIGIVGTGLQGSLEANRAFFADYVNAGRNSARSNLFVYTLPTTPLAEAALFCGFTGPLWYMCQPVGGWGRMIEEAARCAAETDIEAMLLVGADANEAVCLVMQKNADKELFSVSYLKKHLQGVNAPGDVVRILGVAPGMKGS
ncbi:MAG: hypothetical protein HQL22_02690 [Candidatus Omnitrophica bacterium]|nr:hypothetical protein [Candidatus Omnitrophota bacterium]